MPAVTTSPGIIVDTAASPHAQLRPVAVSNVKLTDAFWTPRRTINRRETLLSQYEQIEKTGRLDNFRRAAGQIDKPFQGIYYNDSDVYKWLEAVAWALACEADDELAALADRVIDLIAAAQQPDGYVNTYFMLDKAPERWTNLKDKHEMYCAGHLIQAAVAHARATGADKLLHVAQHLADHIDATFGPAESGKRPGTPGHEELEMALVELYRLTLEPRYLQLAQYLIQSRGHNLAGGDEYHQDHKPFAQFDRMVGHAVRAVYLNCGAADILMETGDDSLRTALRTTLDRLWDNMTQTQMYVTGGIGARYEGEAFGRDYELPNERAYTETCAAIGSVMWNWRMLLLTGEAKYANLMEWTLYNAVLPGLSLTGDEYFYQNPLADDGTHRRQAWFGCACCPPNIARLLAQLPGYFYSVSDNAAWIHLYAQGEATLTLPDGRAIRLTQQSDYPWDGKVKITVGATGAFELRLRIPGWCDDAAIRVNGQAVQAVVKPGSYASLKRDWQDGDVVELDMPMPVQRLESHPYAAENRGRAALARGPLLYCLEAADHPGIDLRDIALPVDAPVTDERRSELLGGVTVLHAYAQAIAPDSQWTDRLYRPVNANKPSAPPSQSVRLTAIPYYAWANRRPGRMTIWLNVD